MSDTEEKDEMLFSEILEDMNNAIEGRNYTTEEFWENVLDGYKPSNYEDYEVEEDCVVTKIEEITKTSRQPIAPLTYKNIKNNVIFSEQVLYDIASEINTSENTFHYYRGGFDIAETEEQKEKVKNIIIDDMQVLLKANSNNSNFTVKQIWNILGNPSPKNYEDFSEDINEKAVIHRH